MNAPVKDPKVALWHSVERTKIEHTKPIVGKAYSGNSPKPYWLVWRATETFGPCGIGWGFEIVEEKLLDGAMLEPGFYERVHMARVRVWYKWGGERGEVEHVGQTIFSGRRRGGAIFTDEDAPKKSVTDALTKALSMIGFAGDIFMGRYDDSKYVAELKQESNGAPPLPGGSREMYGNGNGNGAAPQASKAEWKGPLPVTKLKAEVTALVKDIRACSDKDELNALILTKAAILEQCEHDLPGWYNSPDKDHPGLREVRDAKVIELNKASELDYVVS